MAKIQNKKVQQSSSQSKNVLLDFKELISEQTFKYIFWILIGVIFIGRPLISNEFGPSSDEIYHKSIGELSYEYYTSLGKNDTVFRYKPNERDEGALMMINYSPTLESISAAIYKNTSADPFVVRHLVLTLFTFLLYLFAGLTAYRIAGWRAAVIALLFMLLSPRIFGEAFNNAKDPTFAAAYMFAAYGMIRFIDELLKPSIRTIILLAFGLGFSLMIRAGGIMVYPYLLLFVFLAIITTKEWREQFQKFNFIYYKYTIIGLVSAIILSWFIGIIGWPAALKNPFGHPFSALAIQSQYPTVIRVLFDGQYIPSNEVPWNYNLKYIWLTSPVIVMLGLLLGLGLIPKMLKNFNRNHLFIIIFISAFPLFYIIYKKAALYNGWRHSYFTYTGIVIFAALGFETLFRFLKNRNVHIAIYSLLIAGLLLPAIFIAKNLPVCMNYFNEFAGGMDEAYGNYQIDYYASSAKPAADWMVKNVPVSEGEKIVSNNPWELNVCWESAKHKRQSTYIRFRERNEQDWDYAVFLPQFVDPNMMRKKFFPPKGTIYEVKIDNSVIACVVKRENKSDFYGIEAIKKGDFQNGIPLLEDAVRYDQFNEIAWTYLGIAYANTGRIQDASAALSNALNISPEYQLPQYYYQQIAGMGRR
jgi:tetratricopeptide (TPR) repeat protein